MYPTRLYIVEPRFPEDGIIRNPQFFELFHWSLELAIKTTLSGETLSGEIFVGRNYSSGEIIRRTKLFVGRNYSSGEIIRRAKLFVGRNYSSGEIIRRAKLFVGRNYSSGEILVTKRKIRYFRPTKNS